MRLFYIGLNHRTAPVEIRECLALTPADLAALLAQLAGPACTGAGPLSEAAILSTCNRFEIYGVAEDCDGAAADLFQTLAHFRGLAVEELAGCLTYAADVEAVSHLCAVASGLDSMILGEPQILGQAVEAYRTALRCGTAGPALAALFRKAIECGKRARTETAISEHAASVSHAAVELARQIFGTLQNQHVLLVGAGEMAELAARNLNANGAGQILVVNRSRERADKLASEFGGLAFGWQELGSALFKADIVICSAAAPHVIIRTDTVQNVMRLRGGRPLFLIDIAVPRNIQAEVGDLPNVHLYAIDDLQVVVQENIALRRQEIPKVEAIINQATTEFLAWLRGRNVVSTIRDLRTLAEQVTNDETERALRRLGPLNDREERIVRALGQSIVNKLLHVPTVRLKEYADEGEGYMYVDTLRNLFGLNGHCALAQPAAESLVVDIEDVQVEAPVAPGK
jgi:glutamyl-tRNA reductase